MNLTIPSAHSRPASELPIRKLLQWQSDSSLLFRIDWSSIESLLGCNRAAQFKLLQSRQGGSRSALTFGAAIHAGLEVWYRNKSKIGKLHDLSSDEMPLEACSVLTKEELLRHCFSAIEQSFSEAPPNPFPDYRICEYAIQSFHSYIENYRDELLTPAIHQSKPLVEFSFALPMGQLQIPSSVFETWGFGLLTGDVEREEKAVKDKTVLTISLEWTGIIDMLTELHDGFYVVDHKTTSILSQDFFDGFEIAMQPTGYYTACKAAFPDLPVKGFMVNVLACRKPVASITKSGRPTTSKPFEALRRQYRYSDWHEAEFKRDALALVEELFANIVNGFFPRKTQWCIGKYGKCPFFDVCSLPPKSRESMLASDIYVSNTWKPV